MKNMEEILNKIKTLVDNLMGETQPVDGHDDPGAIQDCFAEINHFLSLAMEENKNPGVKRMIHLVFNHHLGDNGPFEEKSFTEDQVYKAIKGAYCFVDEADNAAGNCSVIGIPLKGKGFFKNRLGSVRPDWDSLSSDEKEEFKEHLLKQIDNSKNNRCWVENIFHGATELAMKDAMSKSIKK